MRFYNHVYVLSCQILSLNPLFHSFHSISLSYHAPVKPVSWQGSCYHHPSIQYSVAAYGKCLTSCNLNRFVRCCENARFSVFVKVGGFFFWIFQLPHCPTRLFPYPNTTHPSWPNHPSNPNNLNNNSPPSLYLYLNPPLTPFIRAVFEQQELPGPVH